MYDRQEIYYVTITSPFKGERVVASVKTDNRFLAEKMFGCGILNAKHFGFKGLYTESEAKHMFRPGTDVMGSMNPATGQFLKHKDYRKVPALFMESEKICRMKDGKPLVLALSDKKNDFDYVLDVISGKIAPVTKMPVQTVHKQSSQAIPVVPKETPTLDSYNLFADQLDETVTEPELEDSRLSDLFDADDFGDIEFYDEDEEPEKPNADVYGVLKQERKSDIKENAEYQSDMGVKFYEAQKTALSSEVDLQASGEFQNKLQERFNLNIGQPIRKQGQSLRELFAGNISN